MFEIGKSRQILFCLLAVLACTNISSMKTEKVYSDIYHDQQFSYSKPGISDDGSWRLNSTSKDVLYRSQVDTLMNKTDFKLKSHKIQYLNYRKPFKNVSVQYDSADKSNRQFITHTSSTMKHSSEIQCPPCEKVHCNPRRPRHLRCRGGLVKGVCGCCPVCAKQMEETCGGHWNYLGTCDRGLICEAVDSSVNPNNDENNISTAKNKPQKKHHFDSSNEIGGDHAQRRNEHFSESTKIFHLKNKSPGSDARKITKIGRSLEGKCVPGYELNDSPTSVVKCRPKCTVEFCLENPKEICSAVNNAEENRSCSGPCQHTSCSACRLINMAPECSACHSEDFDCLKKFGKCLKQEMCSRNHYPCRSIGLYTLSFLSYKEDESHYTFRCFTPNCLP